MTEEEMWELDAAANGAKDDVALNDRVFKAVEHALGRIAREHYPALGNWPMKSRESLCVSRSTFPIWTSPGIAWNEPPAAYRGFGSLGYLSVVKYCYNLFFIPVARDFRRVNCHCAGVSTDFAHVDGDFRSVGVDF